MKDEELVKFDSILVELEYWKVRCEKSDALIKEIENEELYINWHLIYEYKDAIIGESDKSKYLESLKQKQQ